MAAQATYGSIAGTVSVASGAVVPQGLAMGSTAGVNVFAWGNHQIDGRLANLSASFLDGGPLNVSYADLTALVPSQDAVSEFRLQTNNLSPEFGRFTGGVIILSTRSGTNNFHGSACQFFRNRALNANNFGSVAESVGGLDEK